MDPDSYVKDLKCQRGLEETKEKKFGIIKINKEYHSGNFYLNIYILKDEWKFEDFKNRKFYYINRLEECLFNKEYIKKDEAIEIVCVFDHLDYVELFCKIFSKEIIMEF